MQQRGVRDRSFFVNSFQEPYNFSQPSLMFEIHVDDVGLTISWDENHFDSSSWIILSPI